MEHQDTRCLSPEAQDQLRGRVIESIRRGMSKSAAARAFGVSRTSIDTWLTKFQAGGSKALRSKGSMPFLVANASGGGRSRDRLQASLQVQLQRRT